MQFNHAMVWCQDLARATTFYRALGFTRIVDSPHYARLQAPEGDATLSLHLADAVTPPSRTTLYFELASAADLDAKVASLVAAGIPFAQAPIDQPWLWREAHLNDPDGHPIILYFAGAVRLNPPWKVNE